MKRNLELAYLILLELKTKQFGEVIQFAGDKIPFDYHDAPEHEMQYTIKIMKEEGLIALDYPSPAYYITWKGHDFLDCRKRLLRRKKDL